MKEMFYFGRYIIYLSINLFQAVHYLFQPVYHLSIYLYTYLSISAGTLSIYPSIYFKRLFLSIYLSIYLSRYIIYLFRPVHYLSIHQSISSGTLSISASISSIYLFIYISIYFGRYIIYLSINLFQAVHYLFQPVYHLSIYLYTYLSISAGTLSIYFSIYIGSNL